MQAAPSCSPFALCIQGLWSVAAARSPPPCKYFLGVAVAFQVAGGGEEREKV